MKRKFTIRKEIKEYCYKKINCQVVRGEDWEPPTPPRVDLSLQNFMKFQPNEIYQPPKIFDLARGQEKISSEQFRGRHEAVFYSGHTAREGTLGQN